MTVAIQDRPSARPLFLQTLLSNRDNWFWICQIAGWTGYALATFLSITLIDDQVSWPHIGHILLSAGLGILVCWPLRPLFSLTFDLPTWQRIGVASMAVVVFAALWTVLRILVFAWIVGETAVWFESHYWYFGSLFVFLSWTVLFYGISYYLQLNLEHQKLVEESAKRLSEKFARLQAESSARQAQLLMLRYQLNPHFLFNTLNAIAALVKLEENGKAEDMLHKLSKFLRYTLDHDDVQNVCLNKELETLQLYLDIARVRFENRLNLDFKIDEDAAQALVPSMILQPIIENSMKHAIAESEDGGTVSISAQVVGDELSLKVSDTGPGIESTHSDQGRGIGMRNTIDRLETLYGNRYTFETLDIDPSGLSIQIRFPYETAARRSSSQIPSQ